MHVLSCLRAFSLAWFLVLLLVTTAESKTFRLYYLGGQSNMDGYGKVGQLPEDLTGERKAVWIFHGNTSPDRTRVDGRGIWSELCPGHGVGFSSDGKTANYSDRFGVELTFADRLREVDPESHIAIIKYSRGGTSIDEEASGNFGCWDPDFEQGEGEGKGVNQYDHFLATLRNALASRDIDGDGEEDTLIPSGIVWMQGESDAFMSEEVAKRYQSNLKRLMNLIRAALRHDDIPVVIGRISDSGKDPSDGKIWDYGNIVREAQAAFVKKDQRAALVTSTDGYGYSDPYHYDSQGYIDLGRQFADALMALSNQ